MKTDTPRGLKRTTSASSLTNALNFMLTNLIRGWINTADVVRVVSVETAGPGAATGYVDVLPLVCQTDADNDVLPPTTLFRLPYSRIQGGIAALVIDPVPGDLGIAVYTKRDSSGVAQEQKDPVQPGSFRSYDQADGFYIGGFLNKKPDIWLELDQNKVATLHAPEKVVVETRVCVVDASESATVNTKAATVNADTATTNAEASATVNTGTATVNADVAETNATSRATVTTRVFTVNASTSFNVNAPSWNFTGRDGGSGTGVMRGDIRHIGNYDGTGAYTMTGDTVQTGSHTTTGDQVAGGVSQTGHRHTGVETGGGTTGAPV